MRRITLISAPAGYGKTTRAAAWARTTAQRVAWLTLDARDNDPARFFRYLIASLRQAVPDFGPELAAQPLAMALSEAAVQPAVETATIHLVNALQTLREPLLLVLDDLHVIHDPDLLRALGLLAQHLPMCVHLMMLTRADPPLPLTQLRATSALLDIHADDLRLSSDEAHELLRRMGVTLHSAERSALEARVEGWAAGLTLAALSLRGRTDPGEVIARFTGGDRFVLDYVLGEVVARQPRAVQDFLFDTCVLDRLSAPLCDALTGRPSAALLSRVEADNLFLTPLDHARREYRYLPLFAEALQAHLAQRDPGRLNVLHQRAADWHEAAGLLTEAAEHARRAGAAVYAAFLVRQAPGAIARGELRRATGWFDALPDEALHADARLCLLKCWALYVSWQRDRIPALLDVVERARLPGDARTRGELLTLRALLQRTDPESALDMAHAAIRFTPPDDAFVRGYGQMALAEAYRDLGQIEPAIEAYQQAFALHWQAGNAQAMIMATLFVAALRLVQGQPSRGLAASRGAYALLQAANQMDLPAASALHHSLGVLLMETAQFDAAHRHLQQALSLSAIGGSDAFDCVPITQTRLHASRGEAAAAGACIDDMLTDVYATVNPAQDKVVWLAHAALECGRDDDAGRLLRLARSLPNRAPPDLQVWTRLVEAYGQVKAGEADADVAALSAARRELDRVIAGAEQLGLNGYRIEALALRAITAHLTQHDSQAIDDLTRAMALAEPDNAQQGFLHKGDVLFDLLRQPQVRTGPHKRFVAQLLAHHASATLLEPVSTGLIEALSARERDVLALMTDGLTYGQIAERLFVTLNTVRYHVKGLYGKLNATSRAEAISRAREMGAL